MDVQKLKASYEPVAPSPGGASFFSQFYGLFVKRAITFKRDLSVAVISLILPIAISIGAAAIMRQVPVLTCDNPAMIYSVPLTLDLLTLYGANIPSSPYFLFPVNSKVQTATNFLVNPNPQSVANAYPPTVSSFPAFSPNLLESISANRASIPGALNVCCSDLVLSSSGLNAFYNAALLHALPSSLTTAYSSLLKSSNGGTIVCQSWPLPQASTDFFPAEIGASINGNMYGNFILALAVGVALGSLVVNPVVERANRSKFLQIVSGVSSTAYWTATFVFDFCIWTAFVSIYLVILQIFKVGPFTGTTAISLWILMLLSGAATLFMVYCWSFKLATPSGALGASTSALCIFMWVFLTGWVAPTAVILSYGLPLATSDKFTVPLIIAIVFVVVFPPLSISIGGCFLANMVKLLCSMGMKPDANATFYRIFVAINIGQIVVYGVVLFILEAGSKQSVTHSDRDLSAAIPRDALGPEPDADVKTEHDEVTAGQRDGDHVVAKCLRQEFVSAKTGQVKVAVAGISFGVKKGEVLGILGPNGAGKTSTLSILTCDHMPVSGSYAVCRHDATDLDAVRRCIGVCPQHDALFMHMTPTENIYLFARLRGIPDHKIGQMCDNLLSLVKMQPHAHVLCGKLSGGNKRKISLVVSLIGVPPVIFMDEPSSGMDIIAKRFFWRVIEALRKEHAVILTTHSMEEAESVCSRVGIIVDGKLKCLGSLQRIKSVYGTGYDVQLKPGLLDQVPACKSFMRTQLPASILVEEHGTSLKYTVPREAVSSVSFIFETVGKLSRDIGMSEFGVCQTSLEQVFLHFGKQQRILSGIL
jgi:ATP-binding cassette subfamily A (ABC1) protein 3